jgi:ribA/ribD-fused uncharacterized protein
METINSFSNEYQFLSNFYIADTEYEGIIYRSSEAAFQAAKTTDVAIRQEFAGLSSAQAKLRGRTLKLREDWEIIKDQVMYDIVKDKFTRNPYLKSLLLQTNDALLIEGNWWHDNYWGDCSCDKCKDKQGLNVLGVILMRVREELRYDNLISGLMGTKEKVL